MYVSKDFMFAKLSSNYYHGIIICHPLSQWTRQIVSQKTLFTIGILYQPPLASQSAPLMNTCWPVLRTCNSNTFVLFLSFLYSKKEFLQPKNHSSSNHVFQKILSFPIYIKIHAISVCLSVCLSVLFFNPLPMNQFESQIYLWISLNRAEILSPF